MKNIFIIGDSERGRALQYELRKLLRIKVSIVPCHVNYIEEQLDAGEGESLLVAIHAKQGIKISYNVAVDYAKEHAERKNFKIVNLDETFCYERMMIEILSPIAGFSQKVTIGGFSVVGKGYLATLAEKKFSYKKFSVGDDVSRDYAASINMELDDLVVKIKTDKVLAKKYDDMIDEWNRNVLAENDSMVLECRLGALWGKEIAFRVLVISNPWLSAVRLMEDIKAGIRKNQKNYKDADDALVGIARRNINDRTRFNETYQFDFMDSSHYDCVIDNTNITAEEFFRQFYEGYKQFLLKKILK